MKKIMLAVFTVCFTVQLQAQESSKLREVGITFSSLDNFGLTYRSGTEKALWRFNSLIFRGAQNNTFSDSADTYSSQLSTSISVGREFRKSITDKLMFRYGLDVIGRLSGAFSEYDDKSISNNDRSSNQYSIIPGLQLVLGLNYKLNNDLVLGAEMLPFVGYNILISDGNLTSTSNRNSIDYGFSNSNLQLSVAYQF